VELDDLDRRLAGLRTAMEAVSTNLVELETDADRVRLDHATLSGATAARWSDATQSLTSLWQWFSQLNELLERVGQLRGAKKLDADRRRELERLVTGPSIELSSAEIPLAERGLLGPAVSTLQCSPDDLLAAMGSAFDQAKTVVAGCARVWRSLEPRLASILDRQAGADKLAAGLGERHRPELVRLRGQLDDTAQQLASDPLSFEPQTIDPIDATLRAIEADLQGLVVLRDGLAERLSAARAELDELRHAVAAGAEAYREATEKIANPQVCAPLVVGSILEHQLDQATAAAGRAEWRSAKYLLDQWSDRVAAQLAEAQRIVQINRAPVGTRNELRGRLDAYRAKAFRAGLLEDHALSELYGRAHQALYTAPTDLGAAAGMVLRYQQALAGPTARGVRS